MNKVDFEGKAEDMVLAGGDYDPAIFGHHNNVTSLVPLLVKPRELGVMVILSAPSHLLHICLYDRQTSKTAPDDSHPPSIHIPT